MSPPDYDPDSGTSRVDPGRTSGPALLDDDLKVQQVRGRSPPHIPDNMSARIAVRRRRWSAPSRRSARRLAGIRVTVGNKRRSALACK